MSIKTSPLMRVLALVPSTYDTSPGQRFRMEQWAPYLSERGIEIDFQSFECDELHSTLYKPGNLSRKLNLVTKAFARRIGTIREVRKYDVVYVFREAAILGPAFIEYWVHATKVPMIFDFDDAVFVPYKSPSNGYLSLLKFPSKVRTICRLSAHVMAGNAYLADYARQVNDSVSIVPTTIDTEKYQPRASETDSAVPTIGWSGSYSTVQHLDTLRGALQRLAKREKFKLRVIGTSEYSIDGVDVQAIQWRSETETQDLLPIDIGIMPLPDDPWSRGKCGLKALQYMALGIPSVSSPVGVNSEIIDDGRNGMLASTEDEWIEKLATLLRSVELRKKLGDAGRITVETKYSAEVQAPRVHNIIASVAKKTRQSELVLEKNIGE